MKVKVFRFVDNRSSEIQEALSNFLDQLEKDNYVVFSINQSQSVSFGRIETVLITILYHKGSI